MANTELYPKETKIKQTARKWQNSVWVWYLGLWFILSADTRSVVQTHNFCTTVQRRYKCTEQNVLQRRWRSNHRVTDTFLTLLFA